MNLRKFLVLFSASLILLLFLVYSFIPQNEGSEEGEEETGLVRVSKKHKALVFIFGLGGSGTRGVIQLFKSWGCTIQIYKLDKALDNSLLHRLNPQIFDILNHTHSADYDLELLDRELQRTIERRMETIISTIESFTKTNECVAVKWPRIVYLLPILRNYFPESKFVHVVRDGRDMAFSKNEIMFHDFRKYILSEQDDIFPVDMNRVRFWFLVNLQAQHWLRNNLPQKDHALLNIESLVIDSDEDVYRNLWTTAFESEPKPNLADNTIFKVPIGDSRYDPKKYGKFKYVTDLEDKKLVQDIQSSYRTELAEFGYHVMEDLFAIEDQHVSSSDDDPKPKLSQMKKV